MKKELFIESKTKVPRNQVVSVLRLLDEGNTVPFIARYRKENTGNLSDELIEKIEQFAIRWSAIEDRRKTILKSIKEQGLFTSALEKQIEGVDSMVELEDLYAPFKPKRKTKATIAAEKGLTGLAEAIIAQKSNQQKSYAIGDYLSRAVSDAGEAVGGAKDIVIERISTNPRVKGGIRAAMQSHGQASCKKSKKGTDEKGTYQDYYDFSTPIERLKPHQVLAINRGEKEKIINYGLSMTASEWKQLILQTFPLNPKATFYAEMLDAVEDAGQKFILPSVEREIKNYLFETAEDHAIEVFAKNLENLLLQPPLKDSVILGIDPGYRNGCKIAVIDRMGRVLDTGVIYPHSPQNETIDAALLVSKLIEKHRVTVIALGNGTASRESEEFLVNLLKKYSSVKYTVVSEAGASIYSASAVARKEFPKMDVNLRSAISIARRLQDPLAELVKIDPKSIGVGMYQHDVDQKKLSDSLSRVVERVVNRVGVDVNTASPELLAFVSGITEKLANSICEYRNKNGAFKTRKELKKVAGMGARSYQQCAGFLRIYAGKDPLDTTGIHPESYPIAHEILKLANITLGMSPADKEKALRSVKKEFSTKDLAELCGVGEPTISLVMEEIIDPGIDPRSKREKPLLRSKLMEIADLKPGMKITGTIRNVADFGAFIDVGVKQDALMHISRFNGYSPKVGDIIDIIIESVDLERARIGVCRSGGQE